MTLNWQTIDTAPRDRDFFVALRSGYITRGRLVSGRYLATDSMGPVARNTDTTATHWADIPAGPR